MAQKTDPIKALERRIAKLERALEAIIDETNCRAAVDQAESAWAAKAHAQGETARAKLSDLSRGAGRHPR
jgi:hypothetical protein